MRKVILVLLVLSTLLSGGAAHVNAMWMLGGSDTDHLVLHWKSQVHHHHEDGSTSEDASLESYEHLAADALTSVAAIDGVREIRLPQVPSARPVAAEESTPAAPLIDNIDRPPQIVS